MARPDDGPDDIYSDEEEIEESVEEYLDREDTNRMEWDRLNDDLYPHQNYIPESETTAPRVYRDTDAVQVWLRQQRREETQSDA